MRARELWFDGRGHVEIRSASLPCPGRGQVLVETVVSAISAGTELLFYRGILQGKVAVDATFKSLGSEPAYPMRYGYAAVGVVNETGDGVDPDLKGTPVFSFSPHASAFLADISEVLPVPDGLDPDDAAFLANMETAVTLVLDGQPRLQDRVSVFGLGVVGLCTTALLARFPLARLRAYDPIGLRREAAAALGAETMECLGPELTTEDLVFELTGCTDALGPAVAAAAYSGLVVIGSWYGAAPFASGLAAEAAVGNTAFHRGRVRMLASQVSSIDPSLSGRWDRERRLSAAWEAVRTIRPSRWITHRVPLTRAEEAYALLSGKRSEAIQVLLVPA